MRLRGHRVVSLALAVLVFTYSPVPVQAQPALDRFVQATQTATPAAARVTANAPAVMQPVAYLPALFENYDPTYVNPFGVIMYGGVNDVQGLPQMQAAGSHWVTTMLYWSSVEPNPPVAGVHTYTWDAFDMQANNAQAAGINLFVLFTGNPSWAAQYPGGPVTDMTSLVDFVTAMTERYDGDGINDAPGHPIINYWSFYAEPDNGQEARAPGGKGWWGNNPTGYAALLSQISPAIHAANANAKVLIGGLAYDWFTTDVPPGPFVQSFLGNVLTALSTYPGGVTHYLDAIAFHYYPISTTRWPTIRDKALEIKGIVDAHGAGTLPLIVPEMGFWSVPSLGSSEAIQAQTLVQMYVRGLSVGIQQMSWYAVFDYGPGTETDGLFRGSDLNSPKPAYTAYSTLAAELFGARYSSLLSGGGVEGYVFDMGGGRYKTVVWATQASALVAFHLSCVRRVDYMGTITTPIFDGNPTWDRDAVSGQITLQVFQNQPIYVGGC